MAGVKVNFSVDSSQAKTGINNVKKQIESIKGSGSGAADAFDKTARSADNAVRALDSVAGAAGMASTGLAGLAGDIVELFTDKTAGSIALVGALVAATVAVITKVYDKANQSSQQLMKQLQIQQAYHEKRSKTLQETLNKQTSYFERLKQLSKEQRLSNNQREQAASIIELLTSRYDNLGISIDNVTGKIKNLNKAQQQFLIEKTKQKQKDLKNRTQNAKNAAEAILIADDANVAGIIAGMGILRPQQYGGLEGRSIEDLKSQGLNFQMPYFAEVGDKAKVRKANALIGRFNSAKDHTERLAILMEILKNPEIANDDDNLEAMQKFVGKYQEYIDFLEKSKQLDKELKFRLKQLKSKQQAEFIKSMIQTLQDREKQIEKISAETASIWREAGSINDRTDDFYQSNTYNAMSKTQKRSYHWDQYQKSRQKLTTLQGRDKTNKAQIAQLRSELQLVQAQRERATTQNQYIRLKQKELSIKTKLNYAERQSANIWKEIYKERFNSDVHWQKQTELWEEYKRHIQQIKDGIAEEIAKEKQLFDVRDKAFAMRKKQQEIIKQLKQTGFDVDKQQVKELMQQYQKLYDLRANNQFKKGIIDDTKKVKDNFFGRFGDVKGLVTAAQKIVQAEKKLGRSLTEEQKNQLVKIEQLEKTMANFGDLGLDNILKVQTNSLTARGGWAGGVNNMVNLVDINKRIANFSQKQVVLLNDIKKLTSDVGRI